MDTFNDIGLDHQLLHHKVDDRRCSMESKKLGENICSNLYNSTCIFSSITLRCSTFSISE